MLGNEEDTWSLKAHHTLSHPIFKNFLPTPQAFCTSKMYHSSSSELDQEIFQIGSTKSVLMVKTHTMQFNSGICCQISDKLCNKISL